MITFFTALTVIFLVIAMLMKLLAPMTARMLDRMNVKAREADRRAKDRLWHQAAEKAKADALMHDELATHFRRM